MPDLRLPAMSIAHDPSGLTLAVRSTQVGTALVVLGILQAMADDYGALVTFDYRGALKDGDQVTEEVGVEIAMQAYSPGRLFELGARPS